MPEETQVVVTNMAEPPTIDWPAPASANPEPNTNPNHNLQAEPLSQVELQDQMTSPLFQTTLPGPLGNQLDTEMIDIAVSQSLYFDFVALIDSLAIPYCPSSFSDTYLST